MSDDAGSEDRRTCPSCGAEAKPGISNCEKCWRPLPVGSGPVTPSGIQERRYCPSCSVEVKPGVSTCQSCWRPLPLGADLSAPPISQRSEVTSPAPKDLQSATSQPVTTARTEPSTNEPPASAASAVHIDSSPDSQTGREPKLGGDQGVHAPPKTPNQSNAVRVPTRAWWALGLAMFGGVLILIGTVLPWQVFQVRPGYGVERDSFQILDTNVNSHDVDGLAMLAAGLAVILVLLTIGLVMRGRAKRSRIPVVPKSLSISCIVLGAITVAVLIAEYSNVTAAINLVNLGDSVSLAIRAIRAIRATPGGQAVAG